MIPKKAKCIALDVCKCFSEADYRGKGVVCGNVYKVIGSAVVAKVDSDVHKREIHYLIKLPRNKGTWLLPASMFEPVSMDKKPDPPVGQVEL